MKVSKTSGYFSTSVALATLCMAMQAGADITTNALPYVQAFEDQSFEHGSNIVAALGWEATEEDAVKAVVTNFTAPSFPLATNHTTFASVMSDATVHLDGTPYSSSTTWVDFLVKPKRWEEVTAPTEIPENAQLALYVDTNGYLNIFHSIVDNYVVVTQVWSVIDAPEFMIDADEWVRISMNMDYSSPDFVSCYFRLLLNGTPVTHTNAHFNPAGDDYHAEGAADDGQLGSWFAMLKSDAAQINAISIRGTGMFDDMVVNDTEPAVSNIFYYSITAGTTIDGSGTIKAPGNDIIGTGYVKVTPGEDQAFTWTNALGFKFSSVTIGEGGITNMYSSEEYASGYTFTNVQADGSVKINFESLQEIPGTPGLRQWLINTGLGLGFEMTPASWEAYIASTDPTNSTFQFEVTSVWRANGSNYVQWKSIYVDTNLPPFGIEAATNLGAPTVYTRVGSYPRVAGTGAQIITNKWSQSAPAYPVYYRVVATNNVVTP